MGLIKPRRLWLAPSPNHFLSFTPFSLTSINDASRAACNAVMDDEKKNFERDSILGYLLSRQVRSLTFKAGVIEPMPLAFKASECHRPLHHWCHTTLVPFLKYGQEFGREYVLHISPYRACPHSKDKRIAFYTHPLCFCVI
jgi:hypothetical protein